MGVRAGRAVLTPLLGALACSSATNCSLVLNTDNIAGGVPDAASGADGAGEDARGPETNGDEPLLQEASAPEESGAEVDGAETGSLDAGSAEEAAGADAGAEASETEASSPEGGAPDAAVDTGAEAGAPEASADGDSGVLPTTDNAATKDAYVRDGTYANTNYGADNTLVVKQTTPNFTRESWVAFDISRYTHVTSAKLRLYLDALDTSAGIPPQPVTVHYAPTASDGWVESTITWNTAPATGPLVGQVNVDTTAAGTWVEWDVTSAVQADTDGVATLVVVATAGPNCGAIFSSREGANPPVLRITGD